MQYEQKVPLALKGQNFIGGNAQLLPQVGRGDCYGATLRQRREAG